MTVPRRRIIQMAMAMVLAASSLALVWRPLREARRFDVPTPAEMAAAQQLFGTALARPGTGGAIATRAKALGLAARPIAQPPGLALSDSSDDCAGRGGYVLRSGAVRPLAVIAPHRGADRHTGTIARQLFEEHPIAGAAWNSAPRRQAAECPGWGDVARAPSHFITAFSLAVAQRFPSGRVVQLHGFERERGGFSEAYNFDAILSDGTAEPGERLLDVAACLKRGFLGRRIAVYPRDTQVLGATANAQGQALRAAGFAGFTHVEMAPALREFLATDPDARADLFACLEAGS